MGSSRPDIVVEYSGNLVFKSCFLLSLVGVEKRGRFGGSFVKHHLVFAFVAFWALCLDISLGWCRGKG